MTETVPAQTTEVPEAVDFDGVDDYLSRDSDLVGNSDSKTFTFSGWIYLSDNLDGNPKILYANNTGDTGIHMYLSSTGILNIEAWDST